MELDVSSDANLQLLIKTKRSYRYVELEENLNDSQNNIQTCWYHPKSAFKRNVLRELKDLFYNEKEIFDWKLMFLFNLKRVLQFCKNLTTLKREIFALCVTDKGNRWRWNQAGNEGKSRGRILFTNVQVFARGEGRRWWLPRGYHRRRCQHQHYLGDTQRSAPPDNQPTGIQSFLVRLLHVDFTVLFDERCLRLIESRFLPFYVSIKSPKRS